MERNHELQTNSGRQIAGAARIGRAVCPRCDRRRVIFSAVLTPGSPTGCAECLLAGAGYTLTMLGHGLHAAVQSARGVQS